MKEHKRVPQGADMGFNMVRTIFGAIL